MRLAWSLVPLLAAAAWAKSLEEADIPNDSFKPLVRTKRAGEEVVFGNHQNSAQFVKKSDPAASLLDSSVQLGQSTDTESPAGAPQGALTGAMDGAPAEAADSVPADAPAAAPDKLSDLTEEEEALGGNDLGDEEQGSGDVMENEYTDTEMYPNKNDWRSNYYYDYLFPGYRGNSGRPELSAQAPQRTERSAEHALTAESMAPASPAAAAGSRVKRDLTDDIYSWLERGAHAREAYPDAKEEWEDEPQDWGRWVEEEPARVEDYDQSLPMDEASLARLLAADEGVESYPGRDEGPVGEEAWGAPRDLKETKDMLALLAALESEEPLGERPSGGMYSERPVEDIYPGEGLNGGLYPGEGSVDGMYLGEGDMFPGGRPAVGRYADERPVGDVYPGDISETWADMGPEVEEGGLQDEEIQLPYEPIVYRGVPGIFIPVEEGEEEAAPRAKRQYLSLMPGVRKRADFYPYSMEPQGGRWGAVVADEQKRTADAYDRLYSMAAALSGPQRERRGYGDPWGYK